MNKTQQSLASCNFNKEKDLNRSTMHCYALNQALKATLSQNMAKLPENKPFVRALRPR
jgi:hypothetical protein